MKKLVVVLGFLMAPVLTWASATCDTETNTCMATVGSVSDWNSLQADINQCAANSCTQKLQIELTDDIVLANEPVTADCKADGTPLETSAFTTTVVSGGNHKIAGFCLRPKLSAGANPVGLFVSANNLKLTYVNFENIYVEAGSGPSGAVAGIVNGQFTFLNGSVKNVRVESDSTNMFVGGLVGQTKGFASIGKIEFDKLQVSAQSKYAIGGMVGYVAANANVASTRGNITVENRFTGERTTSLNVGGVFGVIDESSSSSLGATFTLDTLNIDVKVEGLGTKISDTIDSIAVGGLVGLSNESSSMVLLSSFDGSVLVDGLGSTPSSKNRFFYVGGVWGQHIHSMNGVSSFQLSNTSHLVNVKLKNAGNGKGRAFLGGLTGQIQAGSEMSTSLTSGRLEGSVVTEKVDFDSLFIGGFAGRMTPRREASTFTDVIVSFDSIWLYVEGASQNTYAGSLFGSLEGVNLKANNLEVGGLMNSSATGGTLVAGGLLGLGYASDMTFSIVNVQTNMYASFKGPKKDGASYVGGFIGDYASENSLPGTITISRSDYWGEIRLRELPATAIVGGLIAAATGYDKIYVDRSFAKAKDQNLFDAAFAPADGGVFSGAGLIGYMYINSSANKRTEILGSYVEGNFRLAGNLTGQGTYLVGGLTGTKTSSSPAVYVSNYRVGGLDTSYFACEGTLLHDGMTISTDALTIMGFVYDALGSTSQVARGGATLVPLYHSPDSVVALDSLTLVALNSENFVKIMNAANSRYDYKTYTVYGDSLFGGKEIWARDSSNGGLPYLMPSPKPAIITAPDWAQNMNLEFPKDDPLPILPGPDTTAKDTSVVEPSDTTFVPSDTTDVDSVVVDTSAQVIVKLYRSGRSAVRLSLEATEKLDGMKNISVVLKEKAGKVFPEEQLSLVPGQIEKVKTKVYYPLDPGSYEFQVKADSLITIAFDVASSMEVSANYWYLVGAGAVDVSSAKKYGFHSYLWDESITAGDYMQYVALDNFNEISETQGAWIFVEKSAKLPFKNMDASAKDSISWNLEYVNTGWNMVANPYSWDIYYADTTEFMNPNSSVPALWTWLPEENRYDPSSSLKAGMGHWFNVGRDTTLTLSTEPYFDTEKKDVRGRGFKKAAADGSWSLRLTLTGASGVKDSWNAVGAGDQEVALLEPPVASDDQVSLYVMGESKYARKHLAKSVKVAGAEDYSWTMKVQGAKAQAGEISIEGLSQLEALGYEATLVVDGKPVLCQNGKSIPVEISAQGSSVILEVYKSSANKIFSGIGQLHLVKMDGHLKVNYLVSKSMEGSKATVSLMDAQGKVVTRRSNKAVAGSNSMELDLPKQAGMYWIYLQVGGKNLVKGMKI